MESAVVANIQKCCVHDGPGLRTVVFLKGCPLRCSWCQNPENLSAVPSVLYNQEKCISCGRCVENCARNTGADLNFAIRYDRTRCGTCLSCADVCLTDARTVCGKQMSAQEVFEAVWQDQVFYRASGGGVTLSGGEPTMHPEFARELFHMLREADIHTAMETCGYCTAETMLRAAEETDLFLFDFKLDTEAAHILWTGKSNRQIKQNLQMLLEIGKRVIIRIPLIPGVNDGQEFHRMMQYLSQFPKIEQIHIMPFHQIGSSKYDMAGKLYTLSGKAECSAQQAEQHADIAGHYGFRVNIGGWDAA